MLVSFWIFPDIFDLQLVEVMGMKLADMVG
jgi:hypothetical protein